MTCVSRASSYFENDPHYHSKDYISPRLLPKFVKYILKLSHFRRYLLKKLSPHGIYEYTIARTKNIDEIGSNASNRGIHQIVIFGAGFDTRGIRLFSEHTNNKVFELDASITQFNKLQQMKRRKIKSPSNIIYIPIDFNKESLRDKLTKAGFQKSYKSLFIMEGILMYLDRTSVADTLQFIKEYAGIKSELIFDYGYASVIRQENLYYGEEEIYDRVSNSQEPWVFGIEKNEITTFLKKFGFELLENLDSNALERKYFTNDMGNLMGQVNGTHCIVYAKRLEEISLKRNNDNI